MDEATFENWWAKFRYDHQLKPSHAALAREIWDAATTAEREACAEVAGGVRLPLSD